MMDVIDDDDDYYDNTETSVTSVQKKPEYFPIPTDLHCTELLASFEANVPLVFKAKVHTKRQNIYSRGHFKQGKVGNIKDLTIRPERSLPHGALNTWTDLTPDVKLPDIRHKAQGAIYYSRGKLCQKLNKAKPEFDLSDPYNKRKILSLQSYSALHDPHCKSYFNNPSVVTLLKKQRLINNRKEVLCDVHEFNQYRSYLGELFNDQVRRRIDDNDAMKELERNLSKSVCGKQKRHQLVAHRQYQLQHAQLNSRMREVKRQKYLAHIRDWRERIEEIETKKSAVRLARKGMYTRNHVSAYLTRQKARKEEEVRKKHILTRIVYSQIKNEYVHKYDRFVKLALMERFKADQAAVMIARDDQIEDMEELVEETLRIKRTGWQRRYDKHIFECRANPEANYKAHLAEEKRERYLERKYFDRWVRLVRNRLWNRLDQAHQSYFNIDRHIRPFVAHMKELSASDLDLDEESSDNEEENNPEKAKKRQKVKDLVKVFPALPLPPVPQQTGNAKEVYKDHQAEVSRRVANALKKHGQGDGHEADVDEADEYIDKVLAKYQFEQRVLQEKLKRSSAGSNRSRKRSTLARGTTLDEGNSNKDTFRESV